MPNRLVLFFSCFLFLLPVSFSAFAESEIKCTDKGRETWLKTDEIKRQAENMGYKIKTFKTLEYCYSILGTDRSGKKAEVFFNPVDGSVFKTEVKK